MSKQPVDEAILRSTSFFHDVPQKYVDGLCSIAELREYQAGEHLNQKLRSADFLYIILEGSISLEQENITGEVIKLETIFPGAAIGFSSLIESDNKRYLTDARTLTPVKALRFRADDLLRMFYQDFELGFHFMRKIALIAWERLVFRTQPLERLSHPKMA